MAQQHTLSVDALCINFPVSISMQAGPTTEARLWTAGRSHRLRLPSVSPALCSVSSLPSSGCFTKARWFAGNALRQQQPGTCQCGAQPTVRVRCRAGTNPNATDPATGRTPLHELAMAAAAALQGSSGGVSRSPAATAASAILAMLLKRGGRVGTCPHQACRHFALNLWMVGCLGIPCRL